ncbi:hypothetical protein Bca52824_002854 [Brassica carinata]|uniref:Uncharacterized protein n=1 Tax=Brassica carinata TaxID=52824 RepID=A0A8X8BAX7_BRACI|nr:hypothetical protein Bca52824_002854 [Brassica carinata]
MGLIKSSDGYKYPSVRLEAISAFIFLLHSRSLVSSLESQLINRRFSSVPIAIKDDTEESCGRRAVVVPGLASASPPSACTSWVSRSTAKPWLLINHHLTTIRNSLLRLTEEH